MNRNTLIYFICISSLIIIFSIYNYTIYSLNPKQKLSNKALLGQQIWQKNNCFNCHQIYGLGGYLGPDLTNAYSDPNKGPSYIASMLKSGVKSMPYFNFSKEETNALLTFLKEIDKSGSYPNYNSKIEPNGWVEITTKNEK